MWKLDVVWRSANQVKLSRKFHALDYQRCSRPHCLRQQKKGKTTNKNDKPSPQPSGSAYERGKEEFGGPPDWEDENRDLERGWQETLLSLPLKVHVENFWTHPQLSSDKQDTQECGITVHGTDKNLGLVHVDFSSSVTAFWDLPQSYYFNTIVLGFDALKNVIINLLIIPKRATRPQIF